MIVVDMLIDYGWKLGPSCHMLLVDSDDYEELHVFAESIGLKRSWFQTDNQSMPHYDLTANKRILAVKKGATEIDRNQLCEILKAYREKVKNELNDYCRMKKKEPSFSIPCSPEMKKALASFQPSTVNPLRYMGNALTEIEMKAVVMLLSKGIYPFKVTIQPGNETAYMYDVDDKGLWYGTKTDNGFLEYLKSMAEDDQPFTNDFSISLTNENNQLPDH